jgi:hypothetical protein
MPAGTPTLSGTGNNGTNNPNLAVTTTRAIAPGSKICIAVTITKFALSSITDTSGLGVVYAVAATSGLASNVNQSSINWVTADAPAGGLPSGTTINFVFAGSDTKKACFVYEVTNALPGTPTNVKSNFAASAVPILTGNFPSNPASTSMVLVASVTDQSLTSPAFSGAGGTTLKDFQTAGAVVNIQSMQTAYATGAGAPMSVGTQDTGLASDMRVVSGIEVAYQAPSGGGGASGRSRFTPYVRTEVAFGSQPADAVTNWTDISPYVYNISSKRGRTNPLEQVDAGSCSFVLDNRDRRFEPLFASSPYYPNVRPLKRIRSYCLENPVVDSDFFRKNAAGSWQLYQGTAGALSVPTYNALGFSGVFNDFFGQVDLGTNTANWAGAYQPGLTFRNATFVTGEYVGASVYVRTTRVNSLMQVIILDNAGRTVAASTYPMNAGWQRIYTTGPIQSGTTSLTIIVQPSSGAPNWTAHDTFQFDAAQLHRFETSNVLQVPALPDLFAWTKTISIFDGYIENWQQNWPGGMDATCTVSAVDGFKPLAPMAVVRGDYGLVVLDDLPTWYFRLGEQDPAQAAKNEAAPNIQDGVYNIQSGSPQLGLPSTYLVGESDTRLQFTGTNGDVHRNVVVIPSKQLAMEAIVQCNPANYPAGIPSYGGAANGDPQVFLTHGDQTGTINGSMVVFGFMYLTGGSNLPYNGMYAFVALMGALGQNIHYIGRNPAGTAAYHTAEHLVGFSWDGSGADGRGGWPLFWYDGVPYDPAPAGETLFQKRVVTHLWGYGFTSTAQAYIGKLGNAGVSKPLYIGNDWSSLWGCRNVYVDEVAYWVNKIPLPGWGARHAAAAAYGAPVEDSGARMNHLLDQATIPGSGLNPWPPSRRNIATGQSQVIPFRWNEQTLVDLIKQDTASEGGEFFFSADGNATFRNRLYSYQYPTSISKGVVTDQPVVGTASFADVGSGGADYDDHDIYNDVRISRFSAGYGDASGQQQVSDATSQANYLIRTLQLDDSIVTTDQEALNAAQWNLYFYKDPHYHANTVKVNPLDDPGDLWRIISLADLQDRLTIIRHPPPGTGTPLTFDILVQAVAHDISLSSWDTEYTIYPAFPNDFWQLPDTTTNDEYAANSVLGSTTRVAY